MYDIILYIIKALSVSISKKIKPASIYFKSHEKDSNFIA